MNAIKVKPEFIALQEIIRDQDLISCLGEQYSEKMWMEYVKDSEEICLLYNLKEIFINLPKDLEN